MSVELALPDRRALDDLETFVGRARRVDPDGACRLVVTDGGAEPVLAVYVSPVHGGGGPTVLGLRAVALAPGSGGPRRLDVTVALSALSDQFARARSTAADVAASSPVPLPLPPAELAASWAGVAPPRGGWEIVGLLDPALLRAVARAGVREVADGVPAGAGAAAVARLRGQVWGRPLAEDPADGPGRAGVDGAAAKAGPAEGGAAAPAAAGRTQDVPAGVAFAAEALGFLDDAEPVALYRLPPWIRATTRRGHVLARRPALL